MLDFEMSPIITKINNKEKNGYITFFNHTFQYLYARTKYLFPNNVECKNFLLVVYQNIYQNINTYSTADGIEHWLSLAILETYHQILAENNIKAFEQIADSKSSSPLALESTLGYSEKQKESSVLSLANIIQQMPPLPKIMSLAFYHDGLQTAQIAEIFECPEIYVSWEIGKAKDFLFSRYKAVESESYAVPYPFSLPLLYASFEFINDNYSVTKEFASLVWEDVCKNYTFKKRKRKKSFTLPILLIFSVLVLAFLFIQMGGNGILSSNHSNISNKKASSNQSNSILNSTQTDTEGLPSKPKTTTTIRNSDGSVKTYDEKGSEIPTEDQKDNTNSGSKTSSSESSNQNDSSSNDSFQSASPNSVTNGNSSLSNNNNSNNSSTNNSSSNNNNSSTNNSNSSTNNSNSSTNQNAASDSSKAASNSNHTVTAPSISTPSVNTPTVNTPTVNTPTVTTPSVSTPTAPTP